MLTESELVLQLSCVLPEQSMAAIEGNPEEEAATKSMRDGG